MRLSQSDGLRKWNRTTHRDAEWWMTPAASDGKESQQHTAQRNFTTLYDTIQKAWNENSKPGSVKHPTPWWNDQCQRSKDLVASSPTPANRQEYQQCIHKAWQTYYRETVQEASNSRKPWKPSKWGNARPPPAFSTLKKTDGKQVSSLPELWTCLHEQFNASSTSTPNLEEIDTYCINNSQFEHSTPLAKQKYRKR
ncbi:hypothetical protein AMATHDRAFT_5983 [Amanita thiersii Skay4041]|uniref:Uncharacterized protein n=1 Tax=Amanita thiersii Skay4041 TaxID=703135 RepID=A0A2A9NDY7_9AGAR|nr:hypothetical protein AMATHDRAFT_5983 [Amanita thiersii Skay4041]